MLFNSLSYLFLLALSRLFVLVPRHGASLLLISSVIFYCFCGLYDSLIFFTSVVVNWLIARGIPNIRWRITLAVLGNVGLLIFFKYAEFLGAREAGSQAVSYITAGIPVGISFYTFHILSYQIDVARGLATPARSFRSFALFVSFFPHLIAGPIVRAHQLLPQLERLFDGNRRRLYLISYGFALFALGLFKKVVLADGIAPYVDDIFHFGPENTYWAWTGAILFTFQIYFDFSGYSDMAIGSAYLLGIKLPVNFRTPYLSRGPQEFWNRWHITLSHWIRDYLYIPLGGNRGHVLRNAGVIILTMAIAGLWHGANYTFVLWGALWGVYIYIARLAGKKMPLPVWLSWPGHMLIVVTLWVVFRAADLDAAYQYLAVMWAGGDGYASGSLFFDDMGMASVLGAFCGLLMALHYVESKIHTKAMLYRLRKVNMPFACGVLIAIIVGLILVQSTDTNPFIYFRF